MCTHLTKRGSRYYFRRRVPKDLQTHYGCREITRTLSTSDRQEAEKRVRQAGVELDREFDQVRATLSAQGAEAQTEQEHANVTTPDYQEVNAKAGEILNRLRQRREEAIQQKRLEAFLAEVQFNLAESEEVLRDGISGLLDDPGPAWAHEARRNAIRALLEGTGGLTTPTPTLTHTASQSRPLAHPKGAGTALHSLVEMWAKERHPQTKTLNMAQRVAERFEQLVTCKPVEDITRADCVAFKNRLLESGQSNENTNKHLVMLNTLLNVASKNALIDSSPASRLTMKETKRAAEKRLSFDEASLLAIFSGPVHSSGKRPRAGCGEAAYWLPILALYTGARLEELGQLHPDDVRQESYRLSDGTEAKAWVIAITDRGEGQGLKNQGSRRRIPIHADLEQLGFIEFAKAQHGQNRIFHELRPDVFSTETGNWSKWFGRYLRETCGVTDERLVFHSFRHTFKDLARLAGIREEVHDALTGHSSGSVSRNYGGQTFPLQPLVEAMQRFSIPAQTRRLFRC